MPTVSLAEQPVFYYDLGSPACYLAAERIMGALPVVPEWEPVLGSALVGREPQPPRERIEMLAVQLGIQPVRWPERWPPDTLMAMRAAAYAKRIGRAVAFSLAAFRQAFAGGRDLGEQDTVLIAGAACEMHPSALLKAVALRSVIEGLEQATERARAAGVSALPAIEIEESVFQGARAVEDAAAELLRLGSAR
jgi:2-hydroxychromene-2-carboxylate isomerase